MGANLRPTARPTEHAPRPESMARESAHATVVAEVSEMIARPGATTDEVLAAVVERAAEVTRGAACVRVVSRRGGYLNTVAAHHVDPTLVEALWDALSGAPRQPEAAPFKRVFATGEPLLLDRLEDLTIGEPPPKLLEFFVQHVPRSMVALPLTAHREVVGLLIACRFEPDTEPLDAPDLSILTSLAERAAWAVEHNVLREELAARADQQSSIASLGALALSGAPEDALLEAMIKSLSHLLGADAVGWLEPTNEPGLLRARAGVGWPEEMAHDGRLAPVAPRGPVQHVLEHGGPVIIDDHLADPRFAPSTLITELGIRSSVLTVIGSPPVGIIGAHSRTVGAFSGGDADALAAAASVVSAAIARRRAEAEVHRLAYRDTVTGLPNRLALQEAVDSAISSGPRAALLLMDLDRFKEVNDTLGHGVGDRLLREVGVRLCGAVKDSAVVARLGGDEFAVVLPGVSRDQAIAVAERITRALRRPIGLDGIDLVAEGSIGIALSPQHGTNGSDLLQSADIAMYRAKRNDHAWSLATSEDTGGDAERIALAAELRRAIDNGDLNLLYQPQFDLSGAGVLAVEALIRWEHPRLGLLHPSSFIELAEHGGMGSRLTWWVVGAALNQVAVWHEAGLDLPVAVNFPPRVLHEPHLAERLADATRELGLDPSSLTVEITEQAVMMTSPTVTENVNRLGDMGMRVSIDDFGTGFSSLAHLQALRVHEVKIDERFVTGMRHDADQRTIVRTLCQLGHNLGMRVVAEGAESLDDLDELARLDVDAAQGFGLARPMPPEEITELYAGGSPLAAGRPEGASLPWLPSQG
jgi:diguanylate cyclase (GGDEF)-like protein